VVAQDYVRYDNYKVLRMQVDPTNDRQMSGFYQLKSNKLWNIDFWSTNDIMVSGKHLHAVKDMLSAHGIRYYPMINNVQELIDRERQHTANIRALERLNGAVGASPPSFFDDYRSADDIFAFLDGLQSTYPSLMSAKLSYGKSYEGRDLYAYTITGSKASSNKVGFFFEGGIHAREWIAHATMAYIANNLVTGYGNDANTTSLMDSIVFTIVPIVNPDGYNYTWVTDRMWRKTRSPNSGSSCVGTDPNRKWDNHWGVAGASTDPCDDAYMGTAAFSESEVSSVATFITKLQAQQTKIIAYIDFHSYSQLWMGPYGWTADLPKDQTDIQNAGDAAVAAIQAQSGMQYTAGPIYTTIYPASGSSTDWAYDNGGIKYSYGVELRDTGEYGFELPANQIVPQGEEVWASILALADYALAH